MGMMDLFTMAGKVVVDSDDANRDIDSVTGKAKSAESKMSAAFKKIRNVIATAFAVDKIISFGKYTVETTAKIQALDSMFTQTFKDNGQKAMELINKQAKDQGINVDRLKGTWASFYGTFRGNGADANQSLELTEQYMRLAADGAAYYDLSLEDVSSRLKSMVMGNFEAGDAIGVNINATKMDIKAKQEYGKAWKDLTDTEKEYLLIDTVGKIYDNSGAMGQGAREADNWSNVTENLKATWERFLSILGSPILKGVTGIVQNITSVIEQLSAKLQTFNVADFIAGLKDAGGVTGSLGETFELLMSIFDTVKNSFISIIKTIINVAKQWYTDNKETVDKIVKSFNEALSSVKQIFTDVTTVIIFLWNTFGKYIFDAIAMYLGYILDRVNNVLGIIKGVFKTISSLIKGDWQGVWEGVKTIFSNALQFIIKLLIEGLIGKFMDKLGSWATAVKNKIKDITSNVTNGFTGMVNSLPGILGKVVNFLTKPFSDGLASIKGWIAKIKDAVANIFNTHIKKPSFSFTGSLNPIDWPAQGLPKLGIKWNKVGALLTKPVLFGQTANQLLGGGEAGNEAVLPLEGKHMLPFAKAIGGFLNNIYNNKSERVLNLTQNIYSPTPLTPSEISRQSKNELRKLALEI